MYPESFRPIRVSSVAPERNRADFSRHMAACAKVVSDTLCPRTVCGKAMGAHTGLKCCRCAKAVASSNFNNLFVHIKACTVVPRAGIAPMTSYFSPKRPAPAAADALDAAQGAGAGSGHASSAIAAASPPPVVDSCPISADSISAQAIGGAGGGLCRAGVDVPAEMEKWHGR